MPCRQLLLESAILPTFVTALLVVQRVDKTVVVDAIKLPDGMDFLGCRGGNNETLGSFVVVAFLVVSDDHVGASHIDDNVRQCRHFLQMTCQYYCAHTHTNARTHTHTHTYTHILLYIIVIVIIIYIYIYIYISIYIYICIYIYIYITYIYIYMNVIHI